MSHKNILKRAWEILWQYRALWVFGFLLALTTASANPQSNYEANRQDFQNNGRTIQPGEDFRKVFQEEMQEARREFKRLFNEGIPVEHRQMVINTIIAVVAVLLLLAIAGSIIRYVSETALIRMVDDYEDTGEKRSVRQGFKLGWSRYAWQVFLIDLAIGLPLFLVFGGLIALAAGMFIYPLAFFSQGTPMVASIVVGIGIIFVLIFLGIVTAVVVRVLKRLVYRSSILEGKGVFEAIKEGFGMIRAHFKDVGLMFLIMIGIDLAFIPVIFIGMFVFGFAALLLGGGVVMMVGGLTGAFAGAIPGIVSTSIVGILMFILLLGLPLAFVAGFKQTYQSSAWTLTFRELRALEGLVIEETPVLDEPAAA